MDQDLIKQIQTAVGVDADGALGNITVSAIARKLGILETSSSSPTPVAEQSDFTLLTDINHEDPWPPKTALAAIIHKATQGLHFQDPAGVKRRAESKAKGVLWGWYHFTSGDNARAQAQNFLDYINKSGGYSHDELVVLDFEHSDPVGVGDMNPSQAAEWIEIVEGALGCRVMVYGSDLLTQAIEENAFPNQPLWPARYREQPPVLPNGRTWAIWQFTDAGKEFSDMDKFAGNLDQLKAAWPNNFKA